MGTSYLLGSVVHMSRAYVVGTISVLREVPRRLVHCHVEAALSVRPALVVSTYEGEGSSGSSP